MSCRSPVRTKLTVKLDGWEAYVHAVEALFDLDGTDTLDRVQASKRRLRACLENLESAANDADMLAASARAKLNRASSQLRKALSAPRPNTAADYAHQKQAILAAMAAAEDELNAIAVRRRNNGTARLHGAIERTMRVMVKLEAELDAGEMKFGKASRRSGAALASEQRDLVERVRDLAAAIAVARRLTDEDAKFVEAEIATGIRGLRDLVTLQSR
jgi:hypothetical protein